MPSKQLKKEQRKLYSSLAGELVIMAGTVMLAYYFEYTDTFSVHVQGFFCYDTTYTKPYLGPEDRSAVPPVLLYAVVSGLPTLLITITETVLFLVQYTSKEFDRSEKTVATGDCCYLNPLVRRTFRFLGVYTFGLFTVDIFVNAGQVVTGNLAPYFLTVCKPNYTALGCQQALRYISHQEACTGNQDDILRARKTFPSKEAALSVYAALYLAVSFALELCVSSVQLPILPTCIMFCCCFLLLFSFLFSLHFPLTPTGQGRWSSTLSLVLLEISSVKGSFSSPLLPRSYSRRICWVASTYLCSLDFIL
ncbi:phospholipid phosphatase-related protein type 5-like isoform X3 [Channa argus]|uniref:phospholipid phosphatase-related protein type 5-like isoform X3 n=1 Tax=Channa argus TaxID=215402 RepID=UPI003520D112